MSLHHSFNIEFAEEYRSIEIAVLIHHFQHWIMVNKRSKRNLKEGRTWSYQTLSDIAAHFPYLSFKQIRSNMEKLIEKGILIKGNFNLHKYDRTCWYAFQDEERFGISRFQEMEVEKTENTICPNGQMENPIQANGECQTGTPIPDSKPDTKTTTKPNLASLASEQAFRLRAKEEVAPLQNPLLNEMDYSLETMKLDKKELHIFLSNLELEDDRGEYVKLNDEQKMQVIRACNLKKVQGILSYMQDHISRGRTVKKGQVAFFFWCMHQDKILYEDDKKSIQYTHQMRAKHSLSIDISEDFVLDTNTGKDVTFKNVAHEVFVKRFDETFIKPLSAPKLNESLSQIKEFSCV